MDPPDSSSRHQILAHTSLRAQNAQCFAAGRVRDAKHVPKDSDEYALLKEKLQWREVQSNSSRLYKYASYPSK